MFNRRSKEDQWFKVAIKLNKKGKLDEPYRSLFDYFIMMTIDAPIKKYREKACLDHFFYFSRWQEKGQLAELVQNLNSILPSALRDNFNRALTKFNNLTDPNDYYKEENHDLFLAEDDFVADDDNAEIIKNILANQVRLLGYQG